MVHGRPWKLSSPRASRGQPTRAVGPGTRSRAGLPARLARQDGITARPPRCRQNRRSSDHRRATAIPRPAPLPDALDQDDVAWPHRRPPGSPTTARCRPPPHGDVQRVRQALSCRGCRLMSTRAVNGLCGQCPLAHLPIWGQRQCRTSQSAEPLPRVWTGQAQGASRRRSFAAPPCTAASPATRRKTHWTRGAKGACYTGAG